MTRDERRETVFAELKIGDTFRIQKGGPTFVVTGPETACIYGHAREYSFGLQKPVTRV